MTDEFWGEPIYSYTEEQAIEDGVLIHPYPQTWPWLLITSGIHAACEADENRTYEQKLVPLLQDCIMEVQRLVKKEPEFTGPAVLEHTVAGTVWVMPNAKGGMTVMKPEEY